MKTIPLLLLGSLMLNPCPPKATAQVQIQALNYWMFWSGNSPNTVSFKDSLHVLTSVNDSVIFSISHSIINKYSGTDTFLYANGQIIKLSGKKRLIFDENLSVGDTIFFGNYYHSYRIIDVKDTTLKDGVVRKTWNMLANVGSPWYYPATWIQGIGEKRQGFNWNPVVSTAPIPHIIAICNDDSLIVWYPYFYPDIVTPSCDFDYLDTYLGINPTATKSMDCSLYPNPADDGLTLDLGGLAGGPITEVAILDLEGKAQTGFTFRQEGTGRLGFYHLEGLAAGSYLIQLRIDNQTHAFAFVKN